MIQVTATDFKTNFGKYLNLVNKEEIHITKNGVDVAIFVAPKPPPSVIDELLGVIPDDNYTVKQARQERRLVHESNG
jgi:antitoxin (DNA-binding transcriptional repressor) of toxin-antitoxin stability system